MNEQFHQSVLLNEMLEYLDPQDSGVYIDGTFGAGGYTRAILNKADCMVYGIDRDPEVVRFTKDLDPNRFKLISGPFGDLEHYVEEYNIKQINGIVFDLGVSSMQLDQAERGFAFMHDGPLDMRMSKDGMTAADLVNTYSEKELADIIFYYGDEPKARRIAYAIVNIRKDTPITTTSQLKSIVHKVYRGNRGKIDPATKTFQAIRISINDELNELEKGLETAFKVLSNHGRLVVITFHSIEDRIVKYFINKYNNKNSEVCYFKKINKQVVIPSDAEVNRNYRARSAKLRAAIKISNDEKDKKCV